MEESQRLLPLEGLGDSAERPVSDHLRPLRLTAAYDLYWYFAAERQAIFFRRLRGEAPPWTEDSVLSTYKFTNAYRALDRTSQYLIRHVIYRPDLPTSAREVFFRIVFFKLFNNIKTWNYLEQAVGKITWESFSFELYDGLLTELLGAGVPIYSSAYIMPPGTKQWGHDKKHRNHLAMLQRMVQDEVPERLTQTNRMQDGFELLRAYPTIGDFLAYQLITDINYSELVDYSEFEFVIPGPGALSGIRKCFSYTAGLNPPELISFLADRQEEEFDRLGIHFSSLWGRRLQLIDCQNLFCEIDKYTRVSNPEITGLFKRTKIKRRFSPHPEAMKVWLPPKWHLGNEGANQDWGTKGGI